MPIELNCGSCGQMLRVADEHAGKQARCPACGAVQPIPAAAPQFPQAPPPSGAPAWRPPGAAAPIPPNPFADDLADAGGPRAGNPYLPPTQPGGAFGGAAHRGGLVLTFGLLGFFCCFVFGILAWIFGADDLRAMREGRMDPSGHSMTQVGMIFGIVSCVLNGLWIVLMAIGAAVG